MAPSSTRPTSLIFTCCPSELDRMMISSNSLGFFSRPSARTLNWLSWPSGAGSAPTRPAGDWAFCSLIALEMSVGVMPSEASFSGSSQMRIE